MNVTAQRSFQRDYRKTKDTRFRERLADAIESLQTVDTLRDVPNVSALRGFEGYHRLRIGDYRLGFRTTEEGVLLMRFLHRSTVYDRFP